MPAMRRELTTHFIYWAVFFAFLILIKQYFNLNVILFILGGILGVFLPDLDHFIYAYFIKPGDLTSQRFQYLTGKSELKRSVELLYETREERRELIFHSIFFQGIFFVLMFWILSSSNSLLGRGVAISFMLHLCIDQLTDLKNSGNLDNWYKNLPYKLDPHGAKIYWITSTAVICLMAVFM
jgi:hypothetical protein